jgi:integrase
VSLHSFFTWLFKKGIRDIPPFPVVEGEDDAKERVALDYTDQVSYLRKIPEQHRDVLEFGMETGIRPGELVALKVKDIDLRHGQALIGRTVSAYTHVLERTKGKTRRYIPLSDRALEIVKPHLEGKHPEQWLFINSGTRRRYSVKMPNALWKRYTRLDATYYEASRHSFCTQLVDDGADSLQAKQLMRHTDVRTTQNYYHGSTTKLRELVNRRGRVVNLKNRSEIEASPEGSESNKIN